MLKVNENYSDYYEVTEDYPEGAAVNASGSDSYDGTPILASFVNNIIGAFQAMFKKAHGSLDGINGEADTVLNSQFADAVAKYTDDAVNTHEIKRGTNAHGATVDASPGQLMTRDSNGRSQIAAPVTDDDVTNKGYVDSGDAGRLSSVQYNSTGKKITQTNGAGTSDVVTVETIKAAMALKKSDVGLGNVDNTADANKSVNYANSAGSAPASDVYSWAKQPSKPGYTKGEVGLGNVENVGVNSWGDPNDWSNAIRCGAASQIAGGVICSSAATSQVKQITINGMALFAGAVVRVLFTNANTAANPILQVMAHGQQVSYSYIKAVKAGAKIFPPLHTGNWRGGGFSNEMWQPYTTLELIFDGADWVIMGNPEVENWSNGTEGYSVLANGYITQWGSLDGLGNNYATVKFYIQKAGVVPRVWWIPIKGGATSADWVNGFGTLFNYNTEGFQIDTRPGGTSKFGINWLAVF